MQWIMLALLFFGQASDQATQAKPADDILMGGLDSPVKIELFSDFECPSCRAF
jgi:protein-disulfide isomerase